MTWPDVHYKKLTVPAWTPCESCEGDGTTGDEDVQGNKYVCGVCQGAGGKWAEAVSHETGTPILLDDYTGTFTPVTKSTILYQLYDPCGECGGKGFTGHRPHYGDRILCKSCLKDSDGSPTGAAEGTGQGWEVEP